MYPWILVLFLSMVQTCINFLCYLGFHCLWSVYHSGVHRNATSTFRSPHVHPSKCSQPYPYPIFIVKLPRYLRPTQLLHLLSLSLLLALNVSPERPGFLVFVAVNNVPRFAGSFAALLLQNSLASSPFHRIFVELGCFNMLLIKLIFDSLQCNLIFRGSLLVAPNTVTWSSLLLNWCLISQGWEAQAADAKELIIKQLNSIDLRALLIRRKLFIGSIHAVTDRKSICEYYLI